MFNGKKIVVVMPAYNAAKTLRRTYDEVMAQGVVDRVILVDDASHDDTVAVAGTLDNVRLHVHPKNQGYGGNQKTCYRLVLEEGADVIIMMHPDYQYTPFLIPAMASMIACGLYPCPLFTGSMLLGDCIDFVGSGLVAIDGLGGNKNDRPCRCVASLWLNEHFVFKARSDLLDFRVKGRT